MPRCKKILADGRRCKVSALKGQQYCLFHSTKKPKYNGGKRGGGKPFRRSAFTA